MSNIELNVVSVLVLAIAIPILIYLIKHPVRTFCLFLLLIPVAEYNLPTPLFALSTANLLTLIILLALLLQFRAFTPKMRMPYLVKINLFALGFLVVSYLIAGVGAISKSATIRFTITSFGFALTFVMPLILIRNIHEYRKAFFFIAMSTFLLSLATVLGAFDYLPGFLHVFIKKSWSDSRTVLGTYRLQVFMRSRGGYGQWLISAFPLVLLSVFWKDKFFVKNKAVMLVTGTIILLGLIAPSSRSTWAAGLLASMTVMAFVGRYQMGLSYIGVFGISLFFGSPLIGIAAEFVKKIYEMDPRSVILRYEWMIKALKTIKEHYFVGLGTGAGPTTSAPGLGVHNQFLDMLVTNGIIGFLVLVLLWVTALYFCFKVVRKPAAPVFRFYGMSLFASLIGIFFEAQCYAGRNKIMWLILGFANCLYKLNQEYMTIGATGQNND